MRKDASQRAEIRIVLRDPDLLDALVAEVTAVAATELGAIGDGSFMEFFQWLIEHSDEIFAIISKLLIIFAESE
ncbi:unnamed protein product [marine sediment metagenome]|uniref:Uncharacterized protein n=1 Tax=marine sediment metagenome TaxID=412755 RepID=X0ZP80_9ZZZZ